MKASKLRDLPKGEFIRLKDSETAPVWVRGDYDRSSKTYSIYKYDDCNHEAFRKGGSLVYYDFTF